MNRITIIDVGESYARLRNHLRKEKHSKKIKQAPFDRLMKDLNVLVNKATDTKSDTLAGIDL